jgi:hypothetical protein
MKDFIDKPHGVKLPRLDDPIGFLYRVHSGVELGCKGPDLPQIGEDHVPCKGKKGLFQTVLFPHFPADVKFPCRGRLSSEKPGFMNSFENLTARPQFALGRFKPAQPDRYSFHEIYYTTKKALYMKIPLNYNFWGSPFSPFRSAGITGLVQNQRVLNTFLYPKMFPKTRWYFYIKNPD